MTRGIWLDELYSDFMKKFVSKLKKNWNSRKNFRRKFLILCPSLFRGVHPCPWGGGYCKFHFSTCSGLQNCVFPDFNLQILSLTGKSNLRSSFAMIQFQVIKNLLKSPKWNKRMFAHFEKMSLARWGKTLFC